MAYQCQQDVDRIVEQISKLPLLVTSSEVLDLKSQLAEAVRGARFVLQGGDCAESFDTCDSPTIANKIKVLLQMSLVLVHGEQKRVVRIGRFAGQYAKPRTEEFETRQGITLPVYSGDLINRSAFTAEDRNPDPSRMLEGYQRSSFTINFYSRPGGGRFRRSPPSGLAAVHGKPCGHTSWRLPRNRLLHQP